MSCGKHFFAAVTREGGLHTWGLDASDGRLGHGARMRTGGAAAGAAPAEAEDGGAAAGAGAGVGEGGGIDAAERAFWLKAPARVTALSRERVLQVIRYTLAA